MLVILTILFWSTAGLLVHSYGLYPLVLRFFSTVVPRPWRSDDRFEPTITIIVPAYNEEKVIAAKIENILSLEYPREKLKIVVGSDQSTDRTEEIARRFQAQGVTVWRAPHRRGKTEIINHLIPHVSTDLVVITDADIMFEPGSLRKVARHFADDRVGCVGGNTLHASRTSEPTEEKWYRSFEGFLKTHESRYSNAIAVFGSFYTVRTKAFEPLPPNAYSNDDVLISMRTIRRGFRVLFDPHAISYEQVEHDPLVEFSRRLRIGAGNYQAFFWLLDFLNPLRGRVWFCYVSHKVLRWFSPFILLVALTTLGLLGGIHPWAGYRIAALAAGGAIGVSCLYRIIPLRPLRSLFYFLVMNAALLGGWVRYLRGIHSAVWMRTERQT